MNDFALAHQKFVGAVYRLATGRGEIKERLAEAFISHLIAIRDESDLPVSVRDEFREVMARMRQVRSIIGEEGTIHASLRAMSTDEAVWVAERVMMMADLVQHEALRNL